jgi:hypothetical protein
MEHLNKFKRQKSFHIAKRRKKKKKNFLCIYVCMYVCILPQINPRASDILDKHSTNDPQSQEEQF